MQGLCFIVCIIKSKSFEGSVVSVGLVVVVVSYCVESGGYFKSVFIVLACEDAYEVIDEFSQIWDEIFFGCF